MSNETMPEKYWILKQTEFSEPLMAESKMHNATEYTRTDTIPDVAELQRQNAALKKFLVKDMIDAIIGRRLISALQKGIVEHVAYDDDDAQSYPVFANWLLDNTAAMPAPSKAEVAREFCRKCLYEGNKATTENELAVKMWKVLKEWEDAEK